MNHHLCGWIWTINCKEVREVRLSHRLREENLSPRELQLQKDMNYNNKREMTFIKRWTCPWTCSCTLWRTPHGLRYFHLSDFSNLALRQLKTRFQLENLVRKNSSERLVWTTKDYQSDSNLILLALARVTLPTIMDLCRQQPLTHPLARARIHLIKLNSMTLKKLSELELAPTINSWSIYHAYSFSWCWSIFR